MSMVDPVFGEVTYAYGWSKPFEVRLWNRGYRIDCVASAYKGQEIAEEQRRQFRYFLERQSDNERRICELLEQYYSLQIGPVITGNAQLQLMVKPTELVFERDGSYAMLFDCSWDADNGVAVRLSPEEQVGPQNLFI
ncbi:hypothetical protein GXP70_02920 [Paenibacillus lycopersici]|uniref:DUF6985 domain-containing protein n=1 Tax=Paenibacillus lycopersici TaxID=2704462 RepID=A0A6C0G2U4_9BACL|nr:hypothetical protein [Paenibacillus lycopersici]QHT59015.1 hypothetical protein GXP70_02920 [Paenibacillus lycopersici]